MLRRATQLDPNFADAWGYLAIADRNLGETQQEQENLKRAFALKDRASARSRSQIEGGLPLRCNWRSVQGD
jgi:predicted Zn-dependent protease